MSSVPDDHFQDVSIQFLTAADDYLEPQVLAEVLRREDEMVIDIPSQDSSDAYLVKGKKSKYFFAGVDSLMRDEPVHVVARWTLLGDTYVGIWVEEGVEYLFSFRLPRGRATRA